MATLIRQVKGYVTSQKNAGAKGLALVTQCIDHMFEHKDWTPLAWLIAKSDSRDGTIFRGILREVTGGVSLSTSSKEAKAQPSGVSIKLSANAAPSGKMPILRKLVEEGTSFRSKSVQSELMDKKETQFDLAAYAKRMQTKLDKEGVSIADLLALFEPVKPSSKTAEPVVDSRSVDVDIPIADAA